MLQIGGGGGGGGGRGGGGGVFTPNVWRNDEPNVTSWHMFLKCVWKQSPTRYILSILGVAVTKHSKKHTVVKQFVPIFLFLFLSGEKKSNPRDYHPLLLCGTV